MDWSISLILRNNFILRLFSSIFLSKERYSKIKALPENIVVYDLKKGIPYSNNSVDAVYHSHLLEHIDRSKVKIFLKEIYRVLKPGGIHRVVVPDFYNLCINYVEHYKKCMIEDLNQNIHDDYIGAILEQCTRKEAYGSSKQNILSRKIENFLLGDARQRGETHQWMYDSENLTFLLKEVGFVDVKLQNYSTSYLSNWSNYKLDTTKIGKEYKPGSLYIEAKK